MSGTGRAVDSHGRAGESEVDGYAILLCGVVSTLKVFVESRIIGRLDAPAGRVDDLTCVVVEGKVHRNAACRVLQWISRRVRGRC